MVSDIVQAFRHALDPVTWAAETLQFKADPWQQQMLRSDHKQVVLRCCRQSGKSTAAAVLALHTAIFRPESLILCVSPTQRQSGELLAKVSGFLRRLSHPADIDRESTLQVKFKSGSRIVSLPGTDPDKIRGFSRPALVIEDESAFVTDPLYFAMRPMLAVGGGRLVLMSTPAGRRGHFYNEFFFGADEDWLKLTITADQCSRIDPKFLEKERARGDLFFRQEYMVEFLDEGDQLFTTWLVNSVFSDELEPLQISMGIAA